MNYLRGEVDDRAIYDGHKIWEGKQDGLYSDRPGPRVREMRSTDGSFVSIVDTSDGQKQAVYNRSSGTLSAKDWREMCATGQVVFLSMSEKIKICDSSYRQHSESEQWQNVIKHYS